MGGDAANERNTELRTVGSRRKRQCWRDRDGWWQGQRRRWLQWEGRSVRVKGRIMRRWEGGGEEWSWGKDGDRREKVISGVEERVRGGDMVREKTRRRRRRGWGWGEEGEEGGVPVGEREREVRVRVLARGWSGRRGGEWRWGGGGRVGWEPGH